MADWSGSWLAHVPAEMSASGWSTSDGISSTDERGVTRTRGGGSGIGSSSDVVK